MKLEDRYLSGPVEEDLSEKMVFIGGPRQVGKTTLARDCVASKYKASYYSWDKIDQRKKALQGEWNPDVELILLDEFHKYRQWKSWIKGEYDVYKDKYRFLLTGSARLNIYREGGDSLQGRYHYYTLHPFTYAEINNFKPQAKPGQEISFKEKGNGLDELLEYGGFPEPFIKQEARFLRRWNNEQIERLFKEDVRELTNIKDMGTLTLLANLIPGKVASILSINSLAKDLQVNFRTIANWLDVFETFYYCFRIAPYQSKMIDSVRKEKKLYLWNWSRLEEEGPKLENLVALHLLKYCDYLYDYEGWNVSLYYLRDATGREVDFLLTLNREPWIAIEVKTKETKLSGNMVYFKEKLQIPYCYQIVHHSQDDFIKGGIRVMPVEKFLTALI
ncbi:MAG TPA: ATP-binding protein [Candidatus Kapabacteria bacterium]|nr:ATP-binding protein [Candidatus Kapabacteria bacterium]